MPSPTYPSDVVKDKVEALPLKPGVYIYKSGAGEIIYVGKAIRLRDRVRSYFRNDPKLSVKTKILVKNIADMEHIVMSSEVEALILENNLIKEHRPRYNIRMKDDKNYQYVKITAEDFPQVVVVRKMLKDGAKYYGPYTSGYAVKNLLYLIQKIFPYRKCTHEFFEREGKPRNPKQIRPCIEFQMGRCIAPCKGPEITQSEHQAIIGQVRKFLEGRADEIIKELTDRMTQAAMDQNFEGAAKIRDQLMAVEHATEKQQAVMTDQLSRDVFGVAVMDDKACVYLFKIRRGILIGKEEFTFEGVEHGEEAEVLAMTFADYYDKTSDIPPEILIPFKLEGMAALAEWLKDQRTKAMEKPSALELLMPERGDKRQVLELAQQNAEERLRELVGEWMNDQKRKNAAMAELKTVLQLPNKPERIECYDISHLGGEGTVASMVVFQNAEPKKADYRHFKIREVSGGDDYTAMQEVLSRRFEYLKGLKIGLEGLKTRQPSPKDMKFIQDKIDAEKLDGNNLEAAQFLAMKFESEIIGFGRVKTYQDNDKFICEIASLWIHPDYRGRKLGYQLISELIQRTKGLVFYVTTWEKLQEYYEGFSFKPIKSGPQVLLDKMARVCAICGDGKPVLLRYDKIIRKKEDVSFTTLPELVVVDGGKGQLSVAVSILKQMGLIRQDVPVGAIHESPKKKKKKTLSKSSKSPSPWKNFAFPIVGLAKEHEEVFVPWDTKPVALKNDSHGSLLLQAARNEAHRFANVYQGKVREKIWDAQKTGAKKPYD